MAGWTKVQASVRNISDSFLSGVSEEQLLQHWDELQAVLEGLDLALQKGRSQMMAVCTTWQRARTPQTLSLSLILPPLLIQSVAIICIYAHTYYC